MRLSWITQPQTSGKGSSTFTTMAMKCLVFVNQAVEAILIKPRRYLSREQERRCREAYRNECVRCGSKERLEYDHIVPLREWYE